VPVHSVVPRRRVTSCRGTVRAYDAAAHPAWRRGASGWGPSALLALPAAELLEPEEEVLQHEAHVQLGVDAHGACIGPRGVGAVRLEEGGRLVHVSARAGVGFER